MRACTRVRTAKKNTTKTLAYEWKSVFQEEAKQWGEKRSKKKSGLPLGRKRSEGFSPRLQNYRNYHKRDTHAVVATIRHATQTTVRRRRGRVLLLYSDGGKKKEEVEIDVNIKEAKIDKHESITTSMVVKVENQIRRNNKYTWEGQYNILKVEKIL